MHIIKCKWVKVHHGLKARRVVTLWGKGAGLAGHQGVSQCWVLEKWFLDAGVDVHMCSLCDNS